MASRDVTLLNSLVDYVLDVKPYHTKIKQFLSELFFEDSFNVNVTEKLDWTLYHQNIWTRDDVGGYRLQRLCEGIVGDKKFRIPAAVWPRFSLTDNPGQTPPGDDLAQGHTYGEWTSSYFLGSDYVPGNPKRYKVPFHQGSRVYINGVQKAFGVDYYVDSTRSFIEFAVAPAADDTIEVQLMKVDRLFIAYNYPFDYNVNLDYDGYGFDLPPYDSGDTPGVLDSDYFQVAIDENQINGYQPPIFHNSIPYNYPKAQLTMLGVGGGSLSGDVWTITAIGPWRFKVTKTPAEGFDLYGFDDVGFDNNSDSTVWYANFKQKFDNGQISFIIDRTWANYYIVGDNNSYDSFELLSFDDWNGATDDTDFLVGLDLITEHGVVVDPQPPKHRPIEFIMKDTILEGGFDVGGYNESLFDEPSPSFTPGFPIGKVKKVTQTILAGPQDYYSFELSNIPLRGTYVELRIEQNGQLNPWLNATITDDMYLKVTWPAGATISVIDPFDDTPYEDNMYDTDEVPIAPGTERLIHNVNLNGLKVYEELQAVDELVLYHGRGVYPTSIVVEHLGSPLTLGNVTLTEYFEGVQLPPDYVGVDKSRVIVSLSSPKPVKVTLTF